MKVAKKYHVSSRCTFTTFFNYHGSHLLRGKLCKPEGVSQSNSICQIRPSLCHLGSESCEHLLHKMNFGSLQKVSHNILWFHPAKVES